MNVTIYDPSFPDIISIQYWDTGILSSSHTLLKAGTLSFDNSDFIETDFKYFQTKTEFSNPDILNELDRNSQTYINRLGLASIEKFLKTLFPTLISGSNPGDNSLGYFSSIVDLDGTETFCFLIPESVSTVRMYSDTESARPCINVSFSGSEIEFSKVLYLVTTYSPGSPRTVNLSWKAYQEDKNPNRVMSDYVLRNDSVSSNFKGYQEKNGYVYSGISSSLVGTTHISNRPIYNLLKGFIGEEWNRNKRYSIDDRAMIGTTEYKSLESNNIGNHPYYSRMWVKA